MLASDLIALLQRRIERWGDRHVIVTWEGVERPIEPKHVYAGSDDGCLNAATGGTEPVLYIDADDNAYKYPPGGFAADPHEGEDGR